MHDRINEEPTSFVGRSHELAELTKKFRSGSRLVTVTGPGGVGKTRTALRFAHTPVSDGTVEGVWVINLSEASSPEELCGVVARELGVALAGHRTEDVVRSIGEFISGQGTTMIVLDNFEHLVRFAKSTIGEWMRIAPQTRFLVTSRERIRIEGENVLMLAPLRVPNTDADVHSIAGYDSVQLFVDRARAVRSEFGLDSANAKPIGELVRRLDGLPLAIELAASRLSVMTVSNLLEAVPGELDVLSDPRRPSPRQASLRATLDWSWNLLCDWEKAAIAQLSAFRGGFFLDAADAVLDLSDYSDAPQGPTGTIDVVQALHDKSLVRSDMAGDLDEFRYSLYGFVREYGAERLMERADAEGVLLRHAEHYTSFELQWIPPSIEEFHRIGIERHNLLAIYDREIAASRPERALAAIMQLEWHFALHGPHDYFVRLLQRAVDGAERTLDASQSAQAQRCLGHAYVRVGLDSLAHECWRRSVSFAMKADKPAVAAASLIELATCQYVAGDLADAEQSFSRASDLADRAGEPQLDWALARLRAARAMSSGELERAQETLLGLVAIARDTQCVFNEMTALLALGACLLQADRAREAGHYLSKCLDLARRYPLAPHAPAAQLCMGQACADQGRRREAELYFQSCLDNARRAGNRRYAASASGQLAALAVEQGDLDKGLELGHSAVRELRTMNDPRGAASWVAVVACIEAMRGEVERARTLLAEAEQHLGSQTALADVERLGVFGAIVELARANALAEDGLESDAAAVFEGIRPHFQPHGSSTEARLGNRLLKAYWDRSGRTPWAQTHRALEIANAGGWFRLDGERVELGRRKALRAALAALAERAAHQPGSVLTAEELFEAGWPGQVARRDSMKNRVYVTVNALRKVGLQRVLQTHEGGYRLDPSVRVSITD